MLFYMMCTAFTLVGCIRKWDWENNYYASPCTCPQRCCLDGSFSLFNDKIMDTNFIQMSGKLLGQACASQNQEFQNQICIIDDASSLQTKINCPIAGWSWSVSKDNVTGSVYWSDQQGCQGVWNVLDMNSATYITLNGIITGLGIIILLFHT